MCLELVLMFSACSSPAAIGQTLSFSCQPRERGARGGKYRIFL